MNTDTQNFFSNGEVTLIEREAEFVFLSSSPVLFGQGETVQSAWDDLVEKRGRMEVEFERVGLQDKLPQNTPVMVSSANVLSFRQFVLRTIFLFVLIGVIALPLGILGWGLTHPARQQVRVAIAKVTVAIAKLDNTAKRVASWGTPAGIERVLFNRSKQIQALPDEQLRSVVKSLRAIQVRLDPVLCEANNLINRAGEKCPDVPRGATPGTSDRTGFVGEVTEKDRP